MAPSSLFADHFPARISTIRYFRRGAFRRHVETLEKLARFTLRSLLAGNTALGMRGMTQRMVDCLCHSIPNTTPRRVRAFSSCLAPTPPRIGIPTHVPCRARPRLSPDSERRHSGRLRIEPPHHEVRRAVRFLPQRWPRRRGGHRLGQCDGDGPHLRRGKRSREVYLCTAAVAEGRAPSSPSRPHAVCRRARRRHGEPPGALCPVHRGYRLPFRHRPHKRHRIRPADAVVKL